MINIIELINKDNLTLSSINALKESDYIIGYDNDLEIISDLIIEKNIIKIDEIDNDNQDSNLESDYLKILDLNIKAIELAISKSFEEKSVSLISNAYLKNGFTNLVFQIASKYSQKVDIKTYSNVSAINHSASILGAPLDDFATINFKNSLIPLSELEKKIEYSIKANFILAIYNPFSNEELFNQFVKISSNLLPESTIVAIVDSKLNSKEIIQLKDLDFGLLNENSFLILGNKSSYKDSLNLEEEFMISPRSYPIRNEILSYTCEFYEKYLNDESPKGLDYDCEYLPCHKELESCDFCYCPFYPCGESSTGGEWIKDKNVWDCVDCLWIHQEDADKAIRNGLDGILEEIDDLNNKKEDLLILRRECLFKTKK